MIDRYISNLNYDIWVEQYDLDCSFNIITGGVYSTGFKMIDLYGKSSGIFVDF